MSLRGALGALLLAAAVVPVAPAQAAGPSSTPGECIDAAGVTVVVDFTDLDGDVVVRCVQGPLPDGMSGLEALRVAGFTVEGTTRWGDAFVCRIQGRPAASEALEYDGESDYHERCQGTPPTQAYWGYWSADDGGSWRYSSESAATREVTEGGFEGWAFALDEPSGKRVPGYTPDRPDRTPPPEPEPTSAPGGNGGSGGSGSGNPQVSPSQSTAEPPTPTTEPTESADVRPQRSPRPERHGDRQGRPDVVDPPDGSAYRSDVKVTGELPAAPATSAESTPVGTLVGAAALLVVVCAGGLAWWRRRSPP